MMTKTTFPRYCRDCKYNGYMHCILAITTENPNRTNGCEQFQWQDVRLKVGERAVEALVGIASQARDAGEDEAASAAEGCVEVFKMLLANRRVSSDGRE